MALEIEYVPLTVEDLPQFASDMKADGWRLVQIMCVNTEDGIDMIYSFMKDGLLSNHEIKGVQKGTTVPSISDVFLEAFFFENEAHALFGVDISNIAIDFGDNFYALSQSEPMTIISPEQKEAREKAKKVAAAKAAREKKAADESADANASKAPAKAPKAATDDAALEAKLAGMDPEKAAKVRAAMAAKAQKEAAAQKDNAGSTAQGAAQNNEDGE